MKNRRRLGIGGIARSSARRPWTTIAVWLVLVVIAGALTSGLADVLTTEMGFTNAPESRRAADLLEEIRGEEPLLELVVVRSDRYTVDDPEFRAFVTPIVGAIRGLTDDVDPSQTVSYFELPIPDLVSEDRATTLVPVTMVGTLDEADEHVAALRDAIDGATGSDAFDVVVGGIASINLDFTEVAESDLSSEMNVLPFALVVLVLVFGSVVAALLPLALAVVAIIVALALATLIGQAFMLSIFVTNMTFTVGMAVGIDYALFIVARYREERRRGHDKLDAIEVAANTATRAVAFSGMTVVIALVGMFIVPTSIFRSLATGAILAVLASVLVSFSLLPAVLSLLGDRIDRLSVPLVGVGHRHEDPEHSFWARTAKWVMWRPVITMAAAAGLLIALAIPYVDIQLGAAGAGTLPEATESARAFEILNEDFEVGRLSPVEVVIDFPSADPRVADAVADLTARLEGDAIFGLPVVQQLDGTTTLVSVPLGADAGSDASTSAVDRLRSIYVPAAFDGVDAEVLVGGAPAMNRDWFATVDTYTPIVFVFVLSLSFILLLMAFRSIVVPLKAIVMNLLSVGASYGLLVLVFQKGFAAGVLGFQQSESIEAWVPLFLFTVLFGLSMDYHVFLLSRIKEHFDETGDNVESVAFGIRTTGGIITGAAAIMVVVFSGFALGDLIMFQQMGFGLAVAVLLDATVVRTVLVPATMRLLGTRNWYFPRWLEWLPQIQIEAPQRPGDRAPATTEPVGAGDVR